MNAKELRQRLYAGKVIEYSHMYDLFFKGGKLRERTRKFVNSEERFFVNVAWGVYICAYNLTSKPYFCVETWGTHETLLTYYKSGVIDITVEPCCIDDYGVHRGTRRVLRVLRRIELFLKAYGYQFYLECHKVYVKGPHGDMPIINGYYRIEPVRQSCEKSKTAGCNLPRSENSAASE